MIWTVTSSPEVKSDAVKGQFPFLGGLAITFGATQFVQACDQVIYGVKRVILKPFMVVAGDHSMNDMAGDEEDSWKSILMHNGFEVILVAEGLGENDSFADIFVNHAADAAIDAGIDLR